MSNLWGNTDRWRLYHQVWCKQRKEAWGHSGQFKYGTMCWSRVEVLNRLQHDFNMSLQHTSTQTSTQIWFNEMDKYRVEYIWCIILYLVRYIKVRLKVSCRTERLYNNMTSINHIFGKMFLAILIFYDFPPFRLWMDILCTSLLQLIYPECQKMLRLSLMRVDQCLEWRYSRWETPQAINVTLIYWYPHCESQICTFVQTREAMREILKDLDEEDFFAIIQFSTAVRTWKRAFIKATKINVAEALAYTDTFRATGGKSKRKNAALLFFAKFFILSRWPNRFISRYVVCFPSRNQYKWCAVDCYRHVANCQEK